MTVTHDIAVLSDKSPLEHEHRIAFRQALPAGVTDLKDVKGTILLCHGFPQSSYQFRKVVGPIADATGYLCIAPDMRGHGFSSKPLDGPEGFTKSLISQDFHEVITKHLKLGDKPVHVVGHDVGAMVAVRYAMQFNPKSLMFGEAPVPGTTVYDGAWNGSGHLWHWHFQDCPHLPEQLVEGREKIYLAWFYNQYTYNPDAVTKDDLEYYAHQYSLLGTMRCAFNTYRAYHQDEREFKAWLKENGKLKMPTTVLSGERCFLATVGDQMGSELAESHKTALVARSGHWLAEENPESFVEQVVKHVKAVDDGDRK